MRAVDLHTHSRASDGTLAPAELVRQACAAGLTGLALTDHDTTAGCAEAAEAAGRLGLRFLPGIEISAEFPRPGTLHLLGYGVDPSSDSLMHLTGRLIEGRAARNEKMIAGLRSAGFEVTLDELIAESTGGVVGRPHLAALLVRKGFVATRQEAFDKYLGQTGAFYLDKEVTTVRHAIDIIHASGGVAVLAHPTQLRTTNDAQLTTVLKSLIDAGLDGVEVYHPDLAPADTIKFVALARKYRLLLTGGSDFHGSAKPHIALGRAGDVRVPETVLDDLEAALRSRRTSSPATLPA